MKKKKYYTRVGAPFRKEKAQIYGERLEYISSMNSGKITPSLIVEDARNIKSPLHNYFEWDDTKAGREYRLQQARDLTNHIMEVKIVEGKVGKYRSFFSIKSKKEGTIYVTIDKSLNTKSYRVQILNQIITLLGNLQDLIKLFRSYEK